MKKKILIGLGAVLLFLGLSYAFVPEVLDGKIVNQGDISHYMGMSHELETWSAEHPDDPARWTGSMFSGMPTAAITIRNGGDATKPLYDFLLLGRRPATYLFVALLGGFLLMLSLGVDWLLAIGGAIAIGFCSYNFQIIQAGHNTKMQAIAFMPWVLAGLLWTYRVALNTLSAWWARTALAAALFGLALSFEIKANHVQITYYLALMIAVYAVVMLIWVLWKHREKSKAFFIASGMLLLTGGLGIASNANQLLPLYDYTPVSMRGGSELTTSSETATTQPGGTLQLDYATQWSYGWNELPNLLIAGFNGGGNGARTGLSDPKGKAALKEEMTEEYVAQAMDAGYPLSDAQRLIRQQYGAAIDRNAGIMAEQMMYWGPQPFTAGPMYVGCITVFLFVLGVCLYDGKEKWWLLAVAVLAALLSVGYYSDGSHDFSIQRLAFSLLPMYGKFRTVSMILVLMQVALPMLGFLALDRVLKDGAMDQKRLLKGIGFSFGAVAAALVLAMIWTRSYVGASDASYLGDQAIRAMAADRKALLTSDALTALALIVATAALLFWAVLSPAGRPGWLSRNRRQLAGGGVALLVLLHMFAMGHRYLNEDHFITPRDFQKVYTERAVDREIHQQDPLRSARVLDLTDDPFNSARASYHHRCIGGYSPAKLQRYQDLIQYYLGREVDVARYYAGKYEWKDLLQGMPILAALNGRFIIDPDGELQLNPYAFGPAWFVSATVKAASPDEEIEALGETDLWTTAVIGPDFEAPASLPGDEADWVELQSYSPNEMRYRYDAASERLLVFSEIYHPDWTATVDGQPLTLLRADWLLRAAVVPAGEHTVVLRFTPAAYATGRSVSLASSLALLLMLLLAAGGCWWSGRKQDTAA